MASYRGVLTFPAWAMDIPEVTEAVKEFRQQYWNDSEVFHDKAKGTIEVSANSVRDGRITSVEKALEQFEVGFDAYSGDYENLNEENAYVRFPSPGEKQQKTVIDGESRIEAQELLDLRAKSGETAVFEYLQKVVNDTAPLLPAVGDIPAPEQPGLTPS